MKLRRANLYLGAFLLGAVAIGALLAPWLAHTDPVMDANLMNAENAPGREFWFGTDGQGRDIYSRVLYGARISLTVGVVSQLINSVIGVTLGVSSGYWGGWWDDWVNGLTNMMLAIPSLIFWRYFRTRVDDYLLTLELAAERFARHLATLRGR